MSIDQLVLAILGEIQDCSNISVNTLLLEEGFLDSMSILFLVSELEEQLSIIIPLDNIIESNFATIEHISAFISKCINE